jgi:tetratricopeptide (TPR) repeat protein
MKSPARTRFFFLPLILGLLGFFFQLSKDKKDTWVVSLLFLMTGLAIIIYLNQTPLQPRERDYAYAGSYYAFAIWIGFGVLAVYDALQKVISNKTAAAGIATGVSLLLVPVVMGAEGWEGHNRSGKYAARDFARMYLESCEPNAILFTNGDNDTFPLWYAQEVEGIRTDVRVVNYMLSSGDWYVDQLFNKAYESDPLPLTVAREKYKLGQQNYVPIFTRIEGRQELKEIIDFVANDDKRTLVPMQDGTWMNYLPTKNLKLTVDSAQVINTGTVRPEFADQIVDEIDWNITQNAVYRNDLMLLDFISTNNWERPIYFANPSSHSGVFNVDKYCHLEGVVYRLKPYPAAEFIKRVGGVDVDRSYEILMADDVAWGRLNEDDVVIDRESQRTIPIMKQNYIRLAQGLSNEGKYDSAVEVMDRGLEFFPKNKVPYDFYMLAWADNYLRAGATEKGVQVIEDLRDRYVEDLNYYSSLNKNYQKFYDDDIQESLLVLQRLGNMARQYKMTELATELDNTLMNYFNVFGLS